MSIEKYLENSKLIKKLQEENNTLFEVIEKEATSKCPFKIDEVIKGKDFSDKTRAVQIRKLKAHIKEDGTIQIIAIGYPMNLDGSYTMNTNNDRKIYIDETTSKITR